MTLYETAFDLKCIKNYQIFKVLWEDWINKIFEVLKKEIALMDLGHTDMILTGNDVKFIHSYKKTLKAKTLLNDVHKKKKDRWKKSKVNTFLIWLAHQFLLESSLQIV